MFGELNYDQEHMEALAREAREMSLLLKSKTPPTDNMTNGQLVGQGVQKLNQNVERLSDRMVNVSNMVQRQSDSFFTAEANLTSEAESIPIPMNFELSNYGVQDEGNVDVAAVDKGNEINSDDIIEEQNAEEYVESRELDLGDINNQNGDKQQEMTDMYDQLDEQELGDITKSSETEEEVYEDAYNHEMENLENINQERGSELQEYNENELISEEQQLQDINQERGAELQEYSENELIPEEQTIQNINNGTTEQQELNDINEVSKKKIENVSTNGESVRQELSDNYANSTGTVENITTQGGSKEQSYDASTSITDGVVNLLTPNEDSGLASTISSVLEDNSTAVSPSGTLQDIQTSFGGTPVGVQDKYMESGTDLANTNVGMAGTSSPSGNNSKEEAALGNVSGSSATMASTYDDTHSKKKDDLADTFNQTSQAMAQYNEQMNLIKQNIENIQKEEPTVVPESAPVTYVETSKNVKETPKLKDIMDNTFDNSFNSHENNFNKGFDFMEDDFSKF